MLDAVSICDAATGELRGIEAYVDKPFLVRLHSGEAWSDGGLVVAMFWGTVLTPITVSGVVIYRKVRRPGRTGLGRVLWLLPLWAGLAAAG